MWMGTPHFDTQDIFDLGKKGVLCDGVLVLCHGKNSWGAQKMCFPRILLQEIFCPRDAKLNLKFIHQFSSPVSEGGKLLVGKSGFSFSLIQCYYPLAAGSRMHPRRRSIVHPGAAAVQGAANLIPINRRRTTRVRFCGDYQEIWKVLYVHCAFCRNSERLQKSRSSTNHSDQYHPAIEVDLCKFAIVLLSRTISNRTRPPKSWQNGVRHCHCLRPQCGMGSRWVIGHVERWQ